MSGLLKFITCGSVDDGKSTLIGHILYDSKLLYADQEKALELDSKVGSRGGAIDYSLLLDGLMAEREQGITIDVAYRYFTTEKRSFIVADTPGHELVTLPSNEHAKVKSILIGDKQADEAGVGRPVTIQLDREVDVSRGCVLAKEVKLPISNSFTATLLWMDDEELTVGKDYLVKLGTKQIPGVLQNIQYKIDVNTGEYIPVSKLSKNEIAVCDIKLQEAIVLDAFDLHKTLGEFILIDRISNMTSACGVIADSEVDDSKDLKCAFAYGNLKANGDIFEEFYYNLDAMTIQKIKPTGKTYTIGDEIPVIGESYDYPEYFDILIFRDKVAVKVRDRKISEIIPIDQYEYTGLPVLNGRGFEVLVDSKAAYQEMYDELVKADFNLDSAFFGKWIVFESYRNIVFKNETWN